ncbi:MAG: 3'-5' exonuclease [Prosthecochloris sp.]|uniref:DNA-directed DNA polymerase n=1 Tax=Prosthecochloris aestuarii (strain DSM 271 / SK 413) TaxID=290512 RepID=B4S8Q4_PROA2|nr:MULTISPECIES: 3'-5' exonuclease [Prosthecochloris]ACF46441.1 DNA-directed DNA polymerase [Prosthecochloris aestuarii DSM 271]NEX11774.1 3'-5' exonuclease [Prosthecochloris sp.]
MKSNVSLLRSGRVIAVDVETTGLSPRRGDRVIEVAAVAIVNGVIEEHFCCLINVNAPIPTVVQKIHGITPELLAGEKPPEAVWPEFLKFIGSNILIAHNAPFDISFIRNELRFLGLSLLNGSQCTLAFSRKKFPQLKNHKLENVARHVLGGMPKGIKLHRASGDALLTAMIWQVIENTQL